MPKTLLIIGGGVEQVPAYERARARGLFVVGTDKHAHAPGLRLADATLLASTRDPEETLAAVQQFHASHPIDGVMTIANDVPYTVATVANALGLPGISLESAHVASNKLLMKQRFAAHNVPCPWFQELGSEAELRQIVLANPNTRYVIKPIDGRGARGVLQIDTTTDLSWAYAESVRWGDCGRVMIEQFIGGMQISSESFLLGGKIYTPTLSERNYSRMAEFSPYIIEDGGTMPAPVSESQRRAIDDLILEGAKAMGITQGIVKGDLVIHEDGTPMIIELAARLSGGWFATHQIPEASGVDLVQAVISHALGEPIRPDDLTPTHHRAVAIRYWFPPSGVVTQIHGEEDLKKIPGLMTYGFFRSPGDFQPPIQSHPDRFGYVMVSAEDRKSVISHVESAIASVRINVQPSYAKPC